MSRAKRILLIVLATLVLAFVGLRIYLTSGSAAGQVSSKLSAWLGVPVEVEDVDIPYIGSSSFEGIRIYERDNASDEPWLRVGEGDADISATSLLGDASPTKVTLRNAELKLRFDGDGKLLTKLPTPETTGKAAPTIVLENTTVTLAQEGRQPMVIRGARLEIGDSGKGLAGLGSIDDDYWEKWSVRVEYHPKLGRLDLRLRAADTKLTQEKLERIPFVPADVWEQVKAAGTTDVDFLLEASLKGTGAHYKVDLNVERAIIGVPAIDLTTHETSGKIVVEDELVTLEKVSGRTADGDIRTSGQLDFRSKVSQLDFDLGLERVHLSGLPKSWGLPDALDGKLSGSADLVVEIDDGEVRTQGKGEGVIDEGNLGKFQFPEPVPILLNADGAKFRFTPRIPKMKIRSWVPGLSALQLRR